MRLGELELLEGTGVEHVTAPTQTASVTTDTSRGDLPALSSRTRGKGCAMTSARERSTINTVSRKVHQFITHGAPRRRSTLASIVSRAYDRAKPFWSRRRRSEVPRVSSARPVAARLCRVWSLHSIASRQVDAGSHEHRLVDVVLIEVSAPPGVRAFPARATTGTSARRSANLYARPWRRLLRGRASHHQEPLLTTGSPRDRHRRSARATWVNIPVGRG